jgi:lipoprotein-anchoring transpeptidase ErfK/SrfK
MGTGGFGMRRSGYGLAAVLTVAALALSGCTATAVATPPAPPPPAAAPAAPTVTVSPTDGATDVAPAAAIRVTASGGTLTGVALTAVDGTAIPGSLSADGLTWTATAPPAFATAYRFTGTAKGAGGSTVVAGGFTTADPKRLVRASTNIGDDAVVGVAAPIEIRFNRVVPAANHAAVERALSVTTSTPVTGSWGWLPDTASGSRVHWRPQSYWPSGTTVSVAARVYGLDLGRAGYGAADLTTRFTIGRAQIVKGDARTHRMQVIRDGTTVMDLPVSYGLESDPRRVTRSGIHVVMGQAPTVLMSNPDYGYTDLPVRWATRISNNGEFIHANPATTGVQGKRNVTHGCINLSTKDAKAYYDTAMFGDPVEITGTSIALSAADGDVYDWAIPWAEWQKLSALT